MSHLSVVAVLPVDLLQGDSLAVEIRIEGAATDLIFECLKNIYSKSLIQMHFYLEIEVLLTSYFSM